MTEKTLGEKRVRTEFNPSASNHIDQIKQKTAKLINLAGEIPFADECKDDDPAHYEKMGFENRERERLIALAQTSYEEAAMWAVKAVTV